jgi:hypothetical protein
MTIFKTFKNHLKVCKHLKKLPRQTEVYSKSAEKGSTNLNVTPEDVFADKNLKSRIDQLLTTVQPGKEHIGTSVLSSLDPV